MAQVVGKKVSGGVIKKRTINTLGELPDRRVSYYANSQKFQPSQQNITMDFKTFSKYLHVTDVRKRVIFTLLFFAFLTLGTISHFFGAETFTTITFLTGFAAGSIILLLLVSSESLT